MDEAMYIQSDFEEHELFLSLWPLSSEEFVARQEALDWMWEHRFDSDEMYEEELDSARDSSETVGHLG